MALFLVVPSRLSEGVKPLFLAATAGLPLSRGIAATITERFLDVSCVAFLMLIAISMNPVAASGTLQYAAHVFGGATVVGIVGIALLLRAPRIFMYVLAYVPFNRVRRGLLLLLISARSTVEPARLLLIYPVCMITWFISYLIFWSFLTVAGRIPLGPLEILNVFVLTTIGLAVAVAPGGLGTFEAAFVFALGAYGYGIVESAMLAVLLRVANLLPAALVVLSMVARGDVDLLGMVRRVRRMQ